jgi:hypothetical protein
MEKVIGITVEFYSAKEYFIRCATYYDIAKVLNLEFLLLPCYILRQYNNLGKDHVIDIEIMKKLKEYAVNGKISNINLACLSEEFPVDSERNKGVLNNWELNEFSMVNQKTPAKRAIIGDLFLSRDKKDIQYVQELPGFGVLGKDANYFIPVSIFLFLNYMTQIGKSEIYMRATKTIVKYCINEIEKGKALGDNQLRAAYMMYKAVYDGDEKYLENY